MTRFFFLFAFLFSLHSLHAQSPTGFGSARALNDGWLFDLTADSTAIAPDLDDRRWQRVSIPHDWSVSLPMSPDGGSCQGYLPGGIGWYRKHLGVSADDLDDGRRLYIYFEGVYNRSTVYLNGHRLGYRPSGFASFLYDLTPHLHAGNDNVLAVRVDHSRANDSRWYTGSGIIRPVWLISANAIHLGLWGTKWKVKQLNKKKATIEVEVDLDQAPDSPPALPIREGAVTIAVEILDAEGKVIATDKGNYSPPYKGGARGWVFNLKNPHLWSLETPYLYKIVTRLFDGNAEVDRSEVPLGLRTFEFSPDKGFALNGRWMKVKGVCVHDDAGVLGTAVPPAVWKYRLQHLKSLGVNAIRMSHNPHDPALYSLCDSLGFLVMDEASDEWEFPKRKWLKGWNQGKPGYEGTFDFFEEWIDRDVADMVRRDRCHPSIFLWSIGNEVDYPNDPYSHPVLDRGGSDFTQPMYGGYHPTQPNAERIGVIAQRLAKVVRDNDDSRAVTGALAGVVMSNETAYPEAVDVVGYNYTESRYAEDHQRYPRRIIYGSENRHDLAAWESVTDNEHIFGQFLWTGIDYLGESGPWPARGSSAGLLDLAGQVKPNGHYRASLWAEHPVCYIGTYPSARPHSRNYRGRDNRQWVSPYASPVWNYDDGQSVRVVCYTNTPSARLFLNDESVGGEPTRDPSTNILYWDITYAPGTLRCEAILAAPVMGATAKARPTETRPAQGTAQGAPAQRGVKSGTVEGGLPALSPSVLATASLSTCSLPFALRATIANSATLAADGLAIVEIDVIDEAGIPVPVADNMITCFVQPPARLLGLENGDIRDTDSKTDNRCRAYGGRLVAYIATSGTSPLRITFTSPLLKNAELTITPNL